MKVTCPSPLEGGLLQANAIFIVLPERLCAVVLQSPGCAGNSFFSTISRVMQIRTLMPPAGPAEPIFTPDFAICSSIILRCSGGIEAICFCICAIESCIWPLPPCILLVSSHNPGLSVWAAAGSTAAAMTAATEKRSLAMGFPE